MELQKSKIKKGTKCNFIKISNLLYKVALHQSEQYCTTAMHADFSHPFLLSSPVQFEICSRSPSFNDHGHGLGPQFYIQLLFIATSPFTLKFDNVLPMGRKTSIKNAGYLGKIEEIFSRNCPNSSKIEFCSQNVVYIPTVDKSGALGLEHGRVAVVNAAIIILSPWGNVHK